MTKDFNGISYNLKQEIVSNFELYKSINELKKIYPEIDYNVLFSVVNSTNEYIDELQGQLCQLEIPDEFIIFESDTHEGSIFENQYYQNKLVDWAVANGARSVFHGGDILQGYNESTRFIVEDKNIAYQAEKFKYRYPSDPSITTYFTLGNHDYLAESLCPRVRPILESRDDFKILGYCMVYVMWHGHIISIKHHVKGFDLRLPKKAEELSFKGHSHFYHIKSPRDNKCERIFIPAMCDDPGVVGEEQKFIKKNKLKTTPGFLTAEDFGECILITYFSFKYGTVIREDEYIKPVTKKLIAK